LHKISDLEKKVGILCNSKRNIKEKVGILCNSNLNSTKSPKRKSENKAHTDIFVGVWGVKT